MCVDEGDGAGAGRRDHPRVVLLLARVEDRLLRPVAENTLPARRVTGSCATAGLPCLFDLEAGRAAPTAIAAIGGGRGIVASRDHHDRSMTGEVAAPRAAAAGSERAASSDEEGGS